ncbi:MAG: hypothetical protein CR982_00515 [Candidatus Cloacimonadota bacterium]|nr:MAG: hypothetical protein CR982_00515 [Candidatus Cloacimonadota bacterium]PIE78868.1 MAG: hypothetical protein CSA15_05615 [Candidatus Delongbacteria bacterium]
MKLPLLMIMLLTTLSFSQFISGRNYDLEEREVKSRSFGASLQGYTSMVDWENSLNSIDSVSRRDNELKYDALKFGFSLHYKQRIDNFEYLVKYKISSYIKTLFSKSKNIDPDSILVNSDFEETLLVNSISLRTLFNSKGFGGDLDFEILSHDNEQSKNSGFILGISPNYTFENNRYKMLIETRYNFINNDAKDIIKFSRSYFLKDIANLGLRGTKKFDGFNFSLLLKYHMMDKDMFDNSWYLETLADMRFNLENGMSFSAGIGVNSNFTKNILDLPIPTYSYKFSAENRAVKNITFGLKFKFEGRKMSISEDHVSSSYQTYTEEDIESNMNKSNFIVYINYDF